MSKKQIVAGNPIEQKRCPIVNDFCMTVSTVNGSGSATANNLLLRSLFRMGIPVSGKNIFPSNIQGLAHLVYHPGQPQGIHWTGGKG